MKIPYFLLPALLLLSACSSPDNSVVTVPATTPPTAETAATRNSVTGPTTTAPSTATAAQPVTVEMTHYTADDPRIRTIGRFDFQVPQRPVFDWSGTAIEFAFSGTDVALVLDELDGINTYNVIVDGRSRMLKSEMGEHRYVLASGLAPGEHQLRLVKRTEPVLGAVAFSDLEISGEGLLDPPAGPERRIEFIGDSITTGFGNEGDSPECLFSAETQNVETTYAAMVAGELGAQYTLIAMSGLGVTTPMQLLGTSSKVTAIDLIDRTLGFETDIPWPPEQQAPDAVVIALGTNDYSTEPNPEDEVFVTAYVELLEAVRVRYPAAHIFAAAGPMVFGNGLATIKTAVERFQTAGDESVTYVFIEDNLERSAEDFGCAWHPNVHGHRKIAAQLTPVIAAELGW